MTGPPGSLSSILRVVCSASMSATPGRARSPSRSPACAAPFRSCTCCSFGHTLPYSVSYPSPLLLHIRQKLPLPPNQTPGLAAATTQIAADAAKAATEIAKAPANTFKAKAEIFNDPSAVTSRGKTQARSCLPLEMMAGQSGCRTALGQPLITFAS